MKRSYKIFSYLFVILLSAGLSGGLALAGSVEGTVQGLNCILHGKLCPVDQRDPHAAAESVFVIYSGNTDYKLVANIDRSILSRYIGKKVRAEGKINPKYNAIDAQSFHVMDNGKYKTVWTLQAELRERENLLRGGGGGQ